jgi:hypothetical protein
MMFTTPAKAFGPYIAEPGPNATSTRSMSCVLRLIAGKLPRIGSFNGCPSSRNSIRSLNSDAL